MHYLFVAPEAALTRMVSAAEEADDHAHRFLVDMIVLGVPYRRGDTRLVEQAYKDLQHQAVAAARELDARARLLRP